MAKHITRWYPDTCRCTIDYEWDDTEVVPEEGDITYTIVDAIKCTIHANEINIMGTVRNENTTKNRVIGLIKLLEPDVDINIIGFEFDEIRHLILKVPGVNGARITKIQNAVNKDFDGVTIKNA